MPFPSHSHKPLTTLRVAATLCLHQQSLLFYLFSSSLS